MLREAAQCGAEAESVVAVQPAQSDRQDPRESPAISENLPTPRPADEPPTGELRRLHPAVMRVWRLSDLITAGVFGLLCAAGVMGNLAGAGSWLAIVAAVCGGLALLSLWHAIVYVPWCYDVWRYAERPQDVCIMRGVWWRERRFVPRFRIQHVDIASGPIDRAFGLTNVSIYTAGTIAAVITIPGVAPEEAERLRATLLALEPSDARRPAPPSSGDHPG